MNYKTIIFLIFVFSQTAFLVAQPGDLFNRFRLGQSYEQAGDIQKAKTIYESVFRQEPDNYQFFEALNRVYTQLKEYDNSISIIEARLKLQPQDINLYGLLGTAWYMKGDEKKASGIWEDGIKLFPDKAVAYRVIANYAIERRAFEEAVNILKRAQKIPGTDGYNFSYDIANIYSMLMKYKEASEEYCSILERDPSQMSLIQARMSQITGKPDALREISQTVERKADDGNNINMLVLLGWLYMEGGRFKDAYGIYLKIDSMNRGTGSELFTFAERALKEGYFEEASSAYRRIFTEYPSSPFVPGARIGYARTLESGIDKKVDAESESWKPFYSVQAADGGLYQQVIEAYEELIRQFDGLEVALEAHFRLGTIRLDRLDDINGAEAAFRKITDYSLNSPFSVNAFARLAEISVRRGNLREANQYYDKIPECPAARSSDKNMAVYMKARILFWQGNFSGSSMLLASVEDNYNENNTNDAIELSLLINTTKNDSLSLARFAEADFLTFQKKFAAAAGIYEKLSQNENLLTLRDLSALRLSEMKLALNDLQNSVNLLTAISEQSDKNIYADRAIYLLGEVYQYGLKDSQKAAASYEKLLAKFPNSLYLDGARENINELNNKSGKNL